MSIIHIPQLLNAAELKQIGVLFDKSSFIDGASTASLGAKLQKNNLQIDKSNTETLPELQEIISNALESSPLFQISAMPHQIYPTIFSKYTVGMTYGWHVDSPLMGNPAIRTDLAMTIFLSDPNTYVGGELMIQGSLGISSFKPNKGDAIVYPCHYLHGVNPISSGERRAAVTWIQSQVKEEEKRKILFEINQVHSMIYQKDSSSLESNLLLQVHSNLLRMWLIN